MEPQKWGMMAATADRDLWENVITLTDLSTTACGSNWAYLQTIKRIMKEGKEGRKGRRKEKRKGKRKGSNKMKRKIHKNPINVQSHPIKTSIWILWRDVIITCLIIIIFFFIICVCSKNEREGILKWSEWPILNLNLHFNWIFCVVCCFASKGDWCGQFIKLMYLSFCQNHHFNYNNYYWILWLLAWHDYLIWFRAPIVY